MEPRLREVRCASAGEWDTAARECAHATLFHTRQWAMLWAEIGRYEPSALHVSFTDGTRLILPCSFRRLRKGLVREYALSPAGAYGGALYGPETTAAHVLTAVQYLTRRHSVNWRINPFEIHARSLADALRSCPGWPTNRWRVSEDSTEVLDLDEFRAGRDLFNHVRHSCRKQIRKGERAGIRVQTDGRGSEWDSFHDLYNRAAANWGGQATIVYPPAIFPLLQRLEPGQVRLWLAYIGGDLVGGSVNFYHNQHAVEWLAAYDPSRFHLGVRNLLTRHMITQAIMEGYAVYDFNPSGKLEGTRRFKQTFVTRQCPAPLATRQPMLFWALDKVLP